MLPQADDHRDELVGPEVTIDAAATSDSVTLLAINARSSRCHAILTLKHPGISLLSQVYIRDQLETLIPVATLAMSRLAIQSRCRAGPACPFR